LRTEDNFFVYYYRYFTEVFVCGGFEWLWFLPALLGIAVINAPFLVWLREQYAHSLSQYLSEQEDWPFPVTAVDDPRHGSMPYLAQLRFREIGLLPAARELPPVEEAGPMTRKRELSLLIPFALTCAFLVLSLHFIPPGKEEDSLRLPWWWTFVATFLPYFWVFLGIKCINALRKSKLRWLLLYLNLQAPIVVTTLLMAPLQRLGSAARMREQAGMMLFHNLFFVRGFIDQTISAEMQAQRRDFSRQRWRPLLPFLWIAGLALTMPGTNENVGYMFAYPLYLQPAMRLIYVLGTWIWIDLIVHYSEAYLEQTLWPWLYRHAVRIAMIAYLFHWPLTNALIVALIRPLKMHWAPSLLLAVPWTLVTSVLVYVLLGKAPAPIRCLCGM
ncbi:MAG: hypothetical protein MHM6MM_008444, partial [Cercozoa sp. M6MM]